MGHYSDYYADKENHINKRDKRDIEKSLKLVYEFRMTAYTKGIQHELDSIEKYYKAKLYDLRYVE